MVKVVEPSMDSFTRHILMFNGMENQLALINKAIAKLKNTSSWKVGLKNFGDERFINLFDVDLQMLINFPIQ